MLRAFLTYFSLPSQREHRWSTGKDGGAGAIFVVHIQCYQASGCAARNRKHHSRRCWSGFSDGIDRMLFFWPRGIAVDAVGAKLYVADMGNGAIRRITLGTFHEHTVPWSLLCRGSFCSACLLSSPTGLSTMGDTLFVATTILARTGSWPSSSQLGEQAPRVHVRHPGGITTDGKRVVFATSLSKHAVYISITAFSHSDNAWAPVPLVGCDGSRSPHRHRGSYTCLKQQPALPLCCRL